MPGGRVWWAGARSIYLDRMVQNVEARLTRGEVPDLMESVFPVEGPTV